MERYFSIVLSTLILTGDAHAYLDPGTGSMLLQGLLAGLLFVGAFWRNIKRYIKGMFQKSKQDHKDF